MGKPFRLKKRLYL